MSLKFGTDGVRGVANQSLTPEFALNLGIAVGRYLAAHGLPMRIALGRDTRKSGPMLGAAFVAGAISTGADCAAMGVVPTGGVSWVTRTGGFGCGVVISASHNPAPDNGIKLFGGDGAKATAAMEEWVQGALGADWGPRPTGAGVGQLIQSRDWVDQYEAWLITLVPERLDGLSVVLDAAHGSGYELAPRVLRNLGASVMEIGTEPDGMNINAEGGATKPQVVQDAAMRRGAMGVALDGDADRAVFSDEQGRLINGDRTMAAWAGHWHPEPNVVVGTIMSNGGFAAYLEAQGVGLERVGVGDKYVSRKMSEIGGKIGGEQSGHLIFAERGPTGDGLVTMLEFLRVLARSGGSASALSDAFENYPQLMANVAVANKDGWEENAAISAVIGEAQTALADGGRVVVRASGTQPMIRVMLEGPDREAVDRELKRIVAVMEREIGGHVEGWVDLTHSLGD